MFYQYIGPCKIVWKGKENKTFITPEVCGVEKKLIVKSYSPFPWSWSCLDKNEEEFEFHSKQSTVEPIPTADSPTETGSHSDRFVLGSIAMPHSIYSESNFVLGSISSVAGAGVSAGKQTPTNVNNISDLSLLNIGTISSVKFHWILETNLFVKPSPHISLQSF